MRRVTATFALALLVGFLCYRVALATMPPEHYDGASVPSCTGTVSPAHFDPLTGIPLPPTCSSGDRRGTSGLWAGGEMYAHFERSYQLGLAVVPVAFVALWWFGRRRRSGLDRRGDALPGIATTLALALCLLGCSPMGTRS